MRSQQSFTNKNKHIDPFQCVHFASAFANQTTPQDMVLKDPSLLAYPTLTYQCTHADRWNGVQLSETIVQVRANLEKSFWSLPINHTWSIQYYISPATLRKHQQQLTKSCHRPVQRSQYVCDAMPLKLGRCGILSSQCAHFEQFCLMSRRGGQYT